jgi:muramoyltetrapeptide carboxypeptidase
VKVAPHALGDEGLLAGKPQDLAADLNGLVLDSTTDWIVCTGGGYNANALLPFIDYEAFGNNPKALVGFSNIDLLLDALSSKSDKITFHGPAVIPEFGRESGPNPFTESALEKALAHEDGRFELEPEETWRWVRPGRASGTLFGGNLWSIEQLLGTPFCPEWTGSILLLEDAFMETHQIAASLTHLQQTGALRQIAGLIAGIPKSIGESKYVPAPQFEELILSVMEGISVPVLMGVPVGHTEKKATVPIGARCHMDSNTNRIAFD